MKPWLIVTAFALLPVWSWALTFPSSFTNEIDGTSLDSSARKIVILVHGWNPPPDSMSDAYEESDQWFYLKNILKLNLSGSEWKLVAYHWENDANTGLISWDEVSAVQNAATAADRAVSHGQYLGAIIATITPNIRQVHIIAHSAGSWVAKEAAACIVTQNPFVTVQVTLLDPFIPRSVPSPLTPVSSLTTSLMNGLAQYARLYRLENYFAEDNYAAGWPTLGTDNTFSWRIGDINQRIDHGLTATPGLTLWYDSHSGPIEFYADTVAATTPGETVQPGLYLNSPPFEFTQVGWYRSLAHEFFLLPRIKGHPQSQTLSSGSSVSLEVVATDSQPLFYQWFRNGLPIQSATNSALPLVVTSSNAGDYVACVSNVNGMVFTDKATISINIPSPPTLSGLSVTGPATVNENANGQFTATALFSSGISRSATPTWSVSPSLASISASGLLSAGAVDADTLVTVSASFTTNGVTKSATAAVLMVNAVGGQAQTPQNLILNGDFAGGTANWSASGSFQADSRFAVARSAPGYAYVANSDGSAGNNLTGEMRQSVSIPANASSVFLSYWYRITTLEPGSSASDFLFLRVLDSSGANVLALLDGRSNLHANSVYEQRTFDLSNYRGQTIMISFVASTDGANPTTFRVDDVSVLATVPPPATLTSVLINGPSSVTEGNSAQYTATAVFSDGTTTKVTPTIWSENSSATTISSAGVLAVSQVQADTTVTVHASYTYSGITREANKDVVIVNVAAPTFNSLAITGPGYISEKESGQFTAAAMFSDGSSVNVSPNWTVSSNVASVSPAGLFSAGEVMADTVVTASASHSIGGVECSANQAVTIRNEVAYLLVSVLANPGRGGSVLGGGTVAYGSSVQLSATPASNWVFAGWSDGDNHNPRTIVVGTDTYPLYTANFVSAGVQAGAFYFSPYSGQSVIGSEDGAGGIVAAQFRGSEGLASDASGNIYVADQDSHTIRKITPDGTARTLAGQDGSYGYADGSGQQARFNQPRGIAVDNGGNVYVVERYNYAVRKISPTGVVSTIAGLASQSGHVDGTGTVARLSEPYGIAVDSMGNLYVSEYNGATIRKITRTGEMTTLAGSFGNSGYSDGTGEVARFRLPRGLAIDKEGCLLVADSYNHAVRKIDTNGLVTTIAGTGVSGYVDGSNSVVQFNIPNSIKVDTNGLILVTDRGNNAIRCIATNGMTSTLALIADASFTDPCGIAIGSSGTLFVSERDRRHVIRKITPSLAMSSFCGLVGAGYSDGVGLAATFRAPKGIAFDQVGNLYVVDWWHYIVRKIDCRGNTTTIAGKANTSGYTNGVGSAARFSNLCDVAVDTNGNVFVLDVGNNAIRKVDPSGAVTTFAGGSFGSADGLAQAAQFNQPRGIALDSSGNLFVADRMNHTIRKITTSGMVSTFAGSAGNSGSNDGNGSSALFYAPEDVTCDAQGNVFVADTSNHTIRKISATRQSLTFAGAAGSSGNADGQGSSARFNSPHYLAIDKTGNLYVTDNNGIRRVSTNGLVETISGNYAVDTTGSGIEVDNIGRLYLSYGTIVYRGAVGAVPLGASVEPAFAGRVTGTGTFMPGSSVVIAAMPDAGWAFTGWADGALDNPRTINVGSNATNFVARFGLLQATVNVSANPSQGGSISGTGVYSPGSAQFISATNIFGWIFTGWVDGNKQNPRLVFVPPGVSSYAATFIHSAAEPVPLSVLVNPFSETAGGSVSGCGMYDVGSQQTLIATPWQYYHFAGWGGQTNGCSIASNQMSVVVDGEKVMTAYFADDRATNSTPHWWLAQYGLTNFNTDALQDDDHDGMSAWQEWLAGSDPTNKDSVFRFEHAESVEGQRMVIRWPSTSSRFYDLSRATNLIAGTNSFVVLPDASNMPATPPENVYTDNVQGVGQYFYKVNVRE